MNRRVALFFSATLFSYLGDMLAVMSIPMFLYRSSGTLTFASAFTVIAILSALVTSKPAAVAIKRFGAIRVILFSDALGALLLLGLGFSATTLVSHTVPFLFVCFLCGLCINFPMFAKGQLLYQYFIAPDELSKLSVLQGRLIGAVFIFSIFSMSALFESLGIKGVLIFDVLTYLPLLVLCFAIRNQKNLGYDSKENTGQKTETARPLEGSSQILRYYFFNTCVYYFATLRSHLFLTVIVAKFGGTHFSLICLLLAVGALLPLLLGTKSTGWISGSEPLTTYFLCGTLVLLGLLLSLQQTLWLVPIAGFLITEANALALRTLRQVQVQVSSFYSTEKMATWATASGSILSAILLPLTMWLLDSTGSLTAFAAIAVTIFLAWIFISRPLLSKHAQLVVLLLGFIFFSSHQAFGFEYRTVMLDKPRIFADLGSNSMSEDERFVLNNVYCGLFNFTVDGTISPELAASWNVEKNGLLYRFKLKSGVKDSEGKEITAQYVQESIFPAQWDPKLGIHVT